MTLDAPQPDPLRPDPLPRDVPLYRPRRSFTRLIEDYNPFYLLSAACMLFGIFALNNSLTWSPLPQHRLLTMIVTLNCYELIVIGLSVFLFRRGIRRDALLLLIVEAFFLADVGFLNMEVFTASFTTGLVVNAVVLVLGVIKVVMIFNAVKIPLNDRRFAFVLAQLAVLIAIPGLFANIAQHRNDFLPPLAVYGAWWIVGGLLAIYAMAGGSLELFRKSSGRSAPTSAVIASRMLLALPMLSIIAHLCLANWVYKVDFHAANLTPLLLGYAILAGHADAQHYTRGKRMQHQLLLPVLAIFLSLAEQSHAMQFTLGSTLAISPLKLALAGTAAVYIEAAYHFHSIAFATVVLFGVLTALADQYFDAIVNLLTRRAKLSADAADELFPKSLAAWGVISIIASFILLALGTLLTLKRPVPIANVINKEETTMTE